MDNWQPLDTARIGKDLILATWGSRFFVEGIDVVRRTDKGWESTLSDTIYTVDGSDGCYTLLKWMPAPALHPSVAEIEEAENKSELDKWVANGCEGNLHQ